MAAGRVISNCHTVCLVTRKYSETREPIFTGRRYTQTSQFIYTHPHSTRSKRCLRELVVGSNSPNPSHAHSGVPFHGVGPTRSLHHSILLIQYHFISMHYQFSFFIYGSFRTTIPPNWGSFHMNVSTRQMSRIHQDAEDQSSH